MGRAISAKVSFIRVGLCAVDFWCALGKSAFSLLGPVYLLGSRPSKLNVGYGEIRAPWLQRKESPTDPRLRVLQVKQSHAIPASSAHFLSRGAVASDLRAAETKNGSSKCRRSERLCVALEALVCGLVW
jgi:hypothetical protein